MYAWINDWVNNREAGDLRRYRSHYVVIVMASDNANTDRGILIQKTKLGHSVLCQKFGYNGFKYNNRYPKELHDDFFSHQKNYHVNRNKIHDDVI